MTPRPSFNPPAVTYRRLTPTRARIPPVVTSTTLTPGTRLGSYEILGPLGSGGMGEVYRARDTRPELAREVAIKVLPGASADPDRRRRLELEAQATGSLNHPNILAIYDVGVHDGMLYLVEELLDGTTLREPMSAGALSPRKAIEYGRAIASGLAAAHAKGVIHRDVKPENVMLTTDGRIKILDFGLAKVTHAPPSPSAEASTRDHGTDPGTVLGTVAYMSPEQVRGLPIDARSDLFSLASCSTRCSPARDRSAVILRRTRSRRFSTPTRKTFLLPSATFRRRSTALCVGVWRSGPNSGSNRPAIWRSRSSRWAHRASALLLLCRPRLARHSHRSRTGGWERCCRGLSRGSRSSESHG